MFGNITGETCLSILPRRLSNSSSSNESNYYNNAAAATSESKTEINYKTTCVSEYLFRPISNDYQKALESTSTPCKVEDHSIMSQEYGSASVSTSSISEYLMETLPGWHVQDFPDPSCLCKVCSTWHPHIIYY